MPLLNTADGLYVGASVATKAYLGSSLVWQDSGTPPPVGASLRGITVATPTVRDTTVNTMAGTLNGDTVFVIRSMNYIELTAMSTPSAAGIGSWTLIEKVKYGNVLIGAWKGTVTSDGVKTITLGGSSGSAADGSSNFGLCYTHAGPHVVSGTSQDAGMASTGASLAIPSTSPAVANTHLIGVWSIIQFTTNNPTGPQVALPSSMSSTRVDSGDYDGWAELVTGYEILAASGSTGTRTGTAFVSSHSGLAGVMFAVAHV